MLIYGGADITYILLLLPVMIFAWYAQMKVNSNFRKYSEVRSSRQLTGAQAAEEILRRNGVTDVRVEPVAGSLTDHFDPRAKVIRLSQPVYGNTSIAAVGVAAHEAGHAVQHNTRYAPILIRNAILPVASFGSKLAIPLVLIGFVLGFLGLAKIGVVLYGAAALFQIATLPVEFNASSRAIAALEASGLIRLEEKPMIRKVLGAAAMTYVAALLVTLVQLLRLILMVTGGRRRD